MDVRRTRSTLLLLACLVLGPGRALALTAGTGTATVALTQLLTSPKVSVTATFASAVGDLGVNLGTLAPFSASNVALSAVNIATGANFSVPFDNGPSDFDANGTISCPASGCATLPGTFSFVGVLGDVNVALLPAGYVYAFDGSVSCTGNVVTGINCSGPFALNAFATVPVAAGATAEVDGSESFRDPSLGASRSYTWKVVLDGISVGGDVAVAGLSKVRGGLPAGFTPDAFGFRALYFDAGSDATFASARVCIEVDADHDGLVDGTSIPVAAMKILHLVAGAFVTVPGFDLLGYACADDLTSLSPFVLIVDPSLVPATTTTTTPGGSTTSTTTTTIPPCSTASQCLAAVPGGAICPEGGSAALQKTIDKKLKAAATKIGKAAAASNAAKAAKLAKAASAALQAIESKADKFLTKKKGPITSDCRERIRRALAPVRSALQANHF